LDLADPVGHCSQLLSQLDGRTAEIRRQRVPAMMTLW
jgi:hypothetical protein